MGFWRLFGLIFWPFRLHSKNLTARGVVGRLGERTRSFHNAPSFCGIQCTFTVGLWLCGSNSRSTLTAAACVRSRKRPPSQKASNVRQLWSQLYLKIMGNELKLRVRRLEGIGEFLHVSNFAHPTSKVLHESLALCFVEQGAYKVRHCGVSYSVGEGALLVAQSGEITSCEDFDGNRNTEYFTALPGRWRQLPKNLGIVSERAESFRVRFSVMSLSAGFS